MDSEGMNNNNNNNNNPAITPVASGLSSNAAKMMAELSGEAAKIRNELSTQKKQRNDDEGQNDGDAHGDRKIARPRGRFSAAHEALFDRMKSINNHPSAWRLKRASPTKGADELPSSPTKQDVGGDKKTPARPNQSLKRTQSKANLDETSHGVATAHPLLRSPAKSAEATMTTATAAATAAAVTKNTADTIAPTTPSLKRTQSKASLADKPTGIPSASAARSLKRTLSRANLDGRKDGDAVPAPVTPKRPDSAKEAGNAATTPATQVKYAKEVPASAVKSRIPAPNVATPSAKRFKTHSGDDASSSRPADAEDTKATPANARPALGGTMTPSRFGSLRHKPGAGSRTPGSLGKTAEAGAGAGAGADTSVVPAVSQTEKVYKFATPSRFSQMRATIQARIAEARGVGTQTSSAQSATVPKDDDATSVAQPYTPTVPASPVKTSFTQASEVLPVFPAAPTTTPSRALFKRAAQATPKSTFQLTPKTALQFTPTTAALVLSQESPTPIKVTTRVPVSTPGTSKAIQVTYPDLSQYKETLEATPTNNTPRANPNATPFMLKSALKSALKKATPRRSRISSSSPSARKETSTPGTFTFRSDHTIQFESPSTAFGATKGQSSIRQVRSSLIPNDVLSIPGSFPAQVTAETLTSDKENTGEDDCKITGPEHGIPHGLEGKKRARVTWEEEEQQVQQEEERRAAKKQRKEHPASAASLFGANRSVTPRATPRAGVGLVGGLASGPASSPIKRGKEVTTPVAPLTGIKKKPFLSASRLNALAQPKRR